MTDYDERSLLNELEPEAGRLYDRHAAVAQEWFPHDYIPYRLGRDFDKEPWTPDQPRLTGVAQTAFEIGLLTEDNLPSYHRLIHGMFGKRRRRVDQLGRPLDRGGGPARHRPARLPDGHPQHRSGRPRARPDDPAPAGLRPRRARHAARTRLRDVPGARDPDRRIATPGATRTIRSPTGSWSASPPTRTSTWSSTATSWPRRSSSSRPRRSAPSSTRSSRSRCRAPAIPGFVRKAAQIAKAGIYDLRVHRDEVLLPILQALADLRADRTSTRRPRRPGRDSAEHLATLDEAARRFEERIATSPVPRISTTG